MENISKDDKVVSNHIPLHDFSKLSWRAGR